MPSSDNCDGRPGRFFADAADGDAAAFRRVFDGVVQQVIENLIDRLLVGPDDG